jgi:hypothetical protein
MAGNTQAELRSEIHASLQRFKYFLLAAAGGALAFVLTRIEVDGVISVADVFWLFSVLAFASSFAFGLEGIQAFTNGLTVEHSTAIVKEQAKIHAQNQPMMGTPMARYEDALNAHQRTAKKIQEAEVELNQKFELAARRASSFYLWQVRLLYGGGLAYAVVALCARFNIDKVLIATNNTIGNSVVLP